MTNTHTQSPAHITFYTGRCIHKFPAHSNPISTCACVHTTPHKTTKEWPRHSSHVYPLIKTHMRTKSCPIPGRACAYASTHTLTHKEHPSPPPHKLVNVPTELTVPSPHPCTHTYAHAVEHPLTPHPYMCVSPCTPAHTQAHTHAH